MSYQLLNHQTIMKDAALKLKRVLFEADPGVGKTLTALSFLEALPPSTRALILCPKSIVKAAWLNDHKKFEIIPQLENGTGTPKKRTLAFEKLERGDVNAVVLNYESFLRDWRSWVDMIDVLILDELTKVKNPNGKTTKAVIKVADTCEFVIGMTGSMHPNGLLDGWSQCRAVSKHIYEGPYTLWRKKYFFQPSVKHSWLWVPYSDSKKKLEEKRTPYTIRVKKQNCMDLPEQTFLRREVELSKDETKMYKQFMKTLVLRLETGDIVAKNALVEMMKARQILSGVVKVGDTWERVGNSKLQEVKSLLQEVDGPAMIACGFRPEVEMYAEELRSDTTPTAILYGQMTEAERDDAITGFQEGRYKYLVCHPAAMAHGLTFVQCADIVWPTLTFDYEHFFQLNQRIHRHGQTKKCTYHLLNAVLSTGQQTVDHNVTRALLGKKDVSMSDIPELAA